MDWKIEFKNIWNYLKMTDTPKEIKDLQLKIWLAKSPAERLRQMLVDNEALYKFWAEMRMQNGLEKL